MEPAELLKGFGARLRELLEAVRPHVDPYDYEEVLNHAEALLAAVAAAVLSSYGYEEFGIAVDRETMEVEVEVPDPRAPAR